MQDEPSGVGAVDGAGFRVEPDVRGVWRLVSPEGRRFFSLGVCCVNPGVVRDEYDPENPAYAAWRYYPDSRAWADSAARRLAQWGFTTVAAWSDHEVMNGAAGAEGLWFTPVLHMGSTAGAPWLDMWDPKVVGRMEEVARKQILKYRDHPRLIGYYTDNEMGWWNATLFKMTLEQPRTSGQRRRLVALLRETYRDDWAALLKDFEVDRADGWRELERGGQGVLMFLRPGGRGLLVMRRFLGMMAQRYYQLCHDIIRKYDGRALIIGDRYQSFYYPEVATAAGRYVHVISTNLNAAWNDGTFPKYHLDTLHRLAKRPVIVSEYYMSAAQNRSGNRNNRGLFPVVATQRERARAAGRTLSELARLPFVVGADWFQFADEAKYGRPDGENFNFGLVDIEDRAYEEVIAAISGMKARLERGDFGEQVDARVGVPPAPTDPLARFEPGWAMIEWDRRRGFVPALAESGPPQSDLYVCWNREAVYLGLYGQDILEDGYYREKTVPKVDRMEWTIHVGDGAAIRIRLGAGRDAVPSDSSVEVWNLSGFDLKVRNIAVVRLPARLFGRGELSAGERVRLRSGLTTHCAGYRMPWGGEGVLGGRGE
jgi:hypothetical protein